MGLTRVSWSYLSQSWKASCSFRPQFTSRLKYRVEDMDVSHRLGLLLLPLSRSRRVVRVELGYEQDTRAPSLYSRDETGVGTQMVQLIDIISEEHAVGA
jgi:hypothetical protein